MATKKQVQDLQRQVVVLDLNLSYTREHMSVLYRQIDVVKSVGRNKTKLLKRAEREKTQLLIANELLCSKIKKLKQDITYIKWQVNNTGT